MKEKFGPVTVHLDLRKRPLKDGTLPVVVRVQWRCDTKFYSTRCSVTKAEWERFSRRPEANHPAMIAFGKYKDAVNTLVREDDFSFQKLASLTGHGGKGTLQELVRAYEAEMRKKRKFNTAGTYNALGVALDDWLHREPMPAGRLTKDDCARFLTWLADERGNGPTTINMRARCLTAVLAKALSDHLIRKNPMEKVKRPQPRRRDLTVSTRSLSNLLNATEKELGPTIFRWVNYWKACYYGNGMNLRDLLTLMKSDLSVFPDGAEITFVRHKTKGSSGRMVRVPLTPELAEALSAIGGNGDHFCPELDGVEPGSETEHRLVRQAVANVNHNLRKACAMLKIPEKITTGTARHSFATRLQQGGAPIAYISDAMGHTRIRTTENYLDGYTNEQRRMLAKLLKV